MAKKLKVRMAGARLRAFVSGRISDDDARAQGYDPAAVRRYHNIPKPRTKQETRLKKSIMAEQQEVKNWKAVMRPAK
jgi:hypothetical protein